MAPKMLTLMLCLLAARGAAQSSDATVVALPVDSSAEPTVVVRARARRARGRHVCGARRGAGPLRRALAAAVALGAKTR